MVGVLDEITRFEIIRLFLGFFGTFTYFMCIKFKLITTNLDNPAENVNSLLNSKKALVFFCIIGGLLPWMLDVRTIYGCFIQGFIFRLTLSSIYPHKRMDEGEASLEPQQTIDGKQL